MQVAYEEQGTNVWLEWNITRMTEINNVDWYPLEIAEICIYTEYKNRIYLITTPMDGKWVIQWATINCITAVSLIQNKKIITVQRSNAHSLITGEISMQPRAKVVHVELWVVSLCVRLKGVAVYSCESCGWIPNLRIAVIFHLKPMSVFNDCTINTKSFLSITQSRNRCELTHCKTHGNQEV